MLHKPTISVLVSARKNSKYLAKFICGYLNRTSDFTNTEILIMLNKHDTWNDDLVDTLQPFTKSDIPIKFFREDKQLGRAGLHEYFNDLYKYASGEWIIYFCEDHFITMHDWDNYLRKAITKHNLNYVQPWCLIPKFDNAGTMNHILSAGFCEALDGVLGRHGWIDSYLNRLLEQLPAERTIRLNDEMFHDFTHDKPSPMTEAHSQGIISEEAKSLPNFDDPRVTRLISKDAKKLNNIIEARA